MNYSLFYKKPIGEEIKAKFANYNEVSNPDYVFAFGGDGTFLKCVRKYIDNLDEITFVGINTGNLGFYSDYCVYEVDDLIKTIENKDYQTIDYSLLDINVVDNNGTNQTKALNEVVITNPIQTLIIDVYINNNYFETFRGTGLLVSTTSGSTAYNKSLGGSVVDPSIDCIQLTEVAPINNRIYKTINSSLILSKESVLKLVVKNECNTFVCVDGYPHDENVIKEVVVKLSDKKVKCITKNLNHFDKVKDAFLK